MNRHDDVQVEHILRCHRDVIASLARLASESTVSRAEFFDDVVLRVSEAAEIDHVKLMRYRPEQSDLLVEAGVGWKEGVVGSVAFPSDFLSPPGRAFRTGEPVKLEDLSDPKDFRISRTLMEHGIVSLLNVPVFVDGAAWGVLEVDSSVLRVFTEDTTEFLIAAAALVGLLITRTEAERAQREAIAATALEAQRRALLLTEMQHRMKNNFQTIMAMVAIRKSRFATPEARSVADEITDGIMAMALAHEQLSSSRHGEVVELGSYLKSLVASIQKSHEEIAMEVLANEMNVGVDQAVPLGLIANEAITNAVKHAFPDHKGRIRVELANEGLGLGVLTIFDDGKGIEENATGGSGLGLMASLARQVRGRIERKANENGGTLVRVFFPRKQTSHGDEAGVMVS